MDSKSLVIGIIIGFVIGYIALSYGKNINYSSIGLPTLCKPNYIQLGSVDSFTCGSLHFTIEECCRTACYNKYTVTSYKLEPTSCPQPIVENLTCAICWCDINNCNSK